MSSKYYEVTAKAFKTVVVEVPDDWKPDCDRQELAEQFAHGEAFGMTDDVEVDSRHTEELTTQDAIERSKRHADEVYVV